MTSDVTAYGRCPDRHTIKFAFQTEVAHQPPINREVLCPRKGCGQPLYDVAVRVAADVGVVLSGPDGATYKAFDTRVAPCRNHPDRDGNVYHAGAGLLESAYCPDCEEANLVEETKVPPDVRILARHGMTPHLIRDGLLYFPRATLEESKDTPSR